ncbi:MAG: sugar ABC transporter substrate-binding protein [Lachnospiraceae bacterium]|jgi:ABC-type sugar transport system substrate-binding protein
MKKFFVMALAVMMIAGLCACGNQGGEKKTEAAADAGEYVETANGTKITVVKPPEGATDLSFLKVGTCVMSFQQEYMINLCKGYEEFQKLTGITWTSTDGGNNEPEKQQTNIENLIESGHNVILAQCVSIDALADLLNQAGEKGISASYYPQDPAVTGAAAYLGYDEYVWGHLLGEAGVKWMKDNYDADHRPVILNLTSSQEKNSIVRCQGMQDAIAEEFGEDGFDWFKVEAVGAEESMQNIESALQAHPDTNMILCYNDNTSTGAYEAAIQSGLDMSKFLIGSCDGTDTILDLMQEADSPFRVTIGNAQFVPEIGFGYMQNGVKWALGLPADDVYNCPLQPIWKDDVEAYRSREPVFELDEDLQAYLDALK